MTPSNPPKTFTQADWQITRKGPSAFGGNVTVTLAQSTRKPGADELAHTYVSGFGKFNWGYFHTQEGKVMSTTLGSDTRNFLRKDGSLVTVKLTVDEDLTATPMPTGPPLFEEDWQIHSDYPDELQWTETIKGPNVRLFLFSCRDITAHPV